MSWPQNIVHLVMFVSPPVVSPPFNSGYHHTFIYLPISLIGARLSAKAIPWMREVGKAALYLSCPYTEGTALWREAVLLESSPRCSFDLVLSPKTKQSLGNYGSSSGDLANVVLAKVSSLTFGLIISYYFGRSLKYLGRFIFVIYILFKI